MVLIRGGGDLGSGVAVALVRAGYRVAVLDLPRPTCLRLTVAFAAAAVEDEVEVGGIRGRLVGTPRELQAAFAAGEVPVWTDGEEALREHLRPDALVDARLKGLTRPSVSVEDAPVVVALGPGYRAGEHAHYVIETNRGPALGRVIEGGKASPHTGVPGKVLGHTEERLLRSPAEGEVERVLSIGDYVKVGEIVARVAGEPVRARLAGMVRGLKLDGIRVGRGHKLGDVDPRRDRSVLTHPSDKAARIGEAVREALVRAGCLPSGAEEDTA